MRRWVGSQHSSSSLSSAQSHLSALLTRMTSSWPAPGYKVMVVKQAAMCVWCKGKAVDAAPYLLSVALTGSTQVFEPEQSVHPVPCLVLVGVT